jgi:hypothetical protein
LNTSSRKSRPHKFRINALARTHKARHIMAIVFGSMS